MKTLYVKDLTAGTPITGETFAIKEKKVQVDKNGQQFYDLVLADKTGEVDAKIWGGDMSNVNRKIIDVGRVVMIDAHVNEFRGRIQIAIKSLQDVDESKLDDYITASIFDSDVMFAELLEVINSIQNQYISRMLNDMFSDRDISRKFKYWPAANSYHHWFRSGLLQHTLECIALTNSLKRFYPEADYDVVIAGMILHDIGKLVELDASGVMSRYTVIGSALSHVYIGTEFVDKFLPQDAPDNLKVHLKHIILSHNGDKEKGAPVIPITLEAQMVSLIDHTSSFIQQYDQAMEDETNEYGMTDLNRRLGTWLWADRKRSDQQLD